MLLLLTLAHAADPAPPPIVNGTATKDYPQVVTLVSADKNGNGSNFCSGTLIHKKWVLTAGHCADAFTANDAAGYPYHYVYVGYDVSKSAGVTDSAGVKALYPYPKWDGTADYQTVEMYDIALLELSTSINSIDPMPVNRDALLQKYVGDDYRYVGWGYTRDNSGDSTKKRTADLPLYGYDHLMQYAYDPDDGQNVCSGDSGGAGLKILGEGMYELSVVNDFVWSIAGGNTPCATGATGGVRVDKYLSWIEQYVTVYSYEEMYGSIDTGTEDTGTADTGAEDSGSADSASDSGDSAADDAPPPEPAGNAVWAICGTPGPLGSLGVLVGLGLAVRRRTARPNAAP